MVVAFLSFSSLIEKPLNSNASIKLFGKHGFNAGFSVLKYSLIVVMIKFVFFIFLIFFTKIYILILV